MSLRKILIVAVGAFLSLSVATFASDKMPEHAAAIPGPVKDAFKELVTLQGNLITHLEDNPVSKGIHRKIVPNEQELEKAKATLKAALGLANSESPSSSSFNLHILSTMERTATIISILAKEVEEMAGKKGTLTGKGKSAQENLGILQGQLEKYAEENKSHYNDFLKHNQVIAPSGIINVNKNFPITAENFKYHKEALDYAWTLYNQAITHYQS